MRRSINREFTDFIKLGGGGQGMVYRARQISLDRLVVLKSQSYANPSEKEALISHIKKISKLSTPHTPSVYEVFADKTNVWIVMEWLQGLSLDKLPALDMQNELSAYFIGRLCRALADFHRSGRCHGDIKPANIIVTCQGDVRLIDLGLSRGEDTTFVQPGSPVLAGTPAYMAPEMKIGRGRASKSADIYALGLVICEVAANFQPVQPVGENFTDNLTSFLSSSQAKIVGACLSEMPGERPADAQQIADSFCVPAGKEARLKSMLMEWCEEPFRQAMAELCLEGSRSQPSVDGKAVYRLLCETLEWDPNNHEAMNALTALPSSGRIKKSWRYIAWPVLGMVLIAAFIIWIGSRNSSTLPLQPEVFVLPKADEERLGKPSVGVKTQSSRKDGNFWRDDTGDKIAGRLILEGLPDSAELLVDDVPLQASKNYAVLSLAPGNHKLVLLRGGKVLWKDQIRLAPFEELKLSIENIMRQRDESP